MTGQWTGKYELLSGDTVLGVITWLPERELEFHGWFGGRFEPAPAYAAVRPRFLELERLEAIDEDQTEEENRAADRIVDWITRAGFRLRSLDMGEVEEVFNLCIWEDGRVMWRTRP